MIKNRILQKYFLMATSLILMFVVLGFVFNSYMMELLRPKMGERLPPIFIAKIVDRINPLDKIKALEELESWQPNQGPVGTRPGPKLFLIDDTGLCLYPKNCSLTFDWKTIALPQKNYDFTVVKNKDPEPSTFRIPILGGPPPVPFIYQNETLVIRLDSALPLFLIMIDGPPPKLPGSLGPFMPLMGLGSLLISLFLGVGVTIAIVYSSVRKGVTVADSVISELKGGNLKARFQISRKDEFGKAMMRFNTMADEIENLVHDLKTSEQARTKLLQELAHDLRTPIASLKNLVDTLQSRFEKLDSETRAELLTLSLKEIDYFERLVEDLLFLAQLKEPNFVEQRQQFNLTETILEVADDSLFSYSQKGKKLILLENLKNQVVSFSGDAHPIKRLIRNAVENACSFANSKITVSLENIDNQIIRITIADDGPGFKPEDLQNFGLRSVSRKLNTNSDGRVSLGLGSVVIKTICDVYHGSLKVQNILDSDGKVLGAELKVELPYQA